MNFEAFSLAPALLEVLIRNKYQSATPIQQKVIPLVLDGVDIIAKAQTGSGKTASFVVPLLDLWLQKKVPKKAKITMLILTPTRELTIQVAKTFELLSQEWEQQPKVATIIGGQSIGEQLLQIQKGCDIVVSTPGRLLDIIDKKQINLTSVAHFIVDEADKMLDLGFAVELDTILKELPSLRQNLLFSATYPEKMAQIASKITQKASMITIENEEPTVEAIEQRAIMVNKEKRSPLLQHLIRTNNFNQVLVFMSSQRSSDNLANKFRKYGFLAESFHGGLDQEERNLTLQDFKDQKIKILFCTDIASRGLHIDDVSCVVNYDLPRSPADYIHRIGRTARAGKQGTALSFIGLEDKEHFALIEKRANIVLKKEQIEGFALEGSFVAPLKGKAPIKGKRKSKKDKLREAQAKREND